MESSAEKLARIRNELKQAERETGDIGDIDYKNGDLYDEDSGEHLGQIDVKDAHDGKEVDTIPAKLSMYMNGYFYVFNMHARYKAEDDNDQEKN